MIKSYQVNIGEKFKKDLDEANRFHSDAHVDQFRLMDDGSPVVGAKLDEFPKTIIKQKLFLDEVLTDISDVDRMAVDLDKSARNVKFLQVGVKNRVAKENQLSDQGIQLAQQIANVQQ